MKIKRICHECVGEKFLSKQILNCGDQRKCSYCHKSAKTLTIKQFSKKIQRAFNDYYTRSLNAPDNLVYILSANEPGYIWETKGESLEDMIVHMAVVPEEAAKDAHSVLAIEHYGNSNDVMGMESDFGENMFYVRKEISDEYWQWKWSNFEDSLKTKARFFDKNAADHLDAVFDGIETMKSSDGRPLVTSIGPNKVISALFRARVFQNDDKLAYALSQPVVELGTPSSKYASGGRMNAWGIPVFYGALEPRTAIAEVRPSVGSRVSVVKFELTRELLLLDLKALSEVLITGSIFDESYLGKLERAMFLRSLSWRISKAVMPDDVLTDYIVTQAIADYLSVGSKYPLDGIVYPSVQVQPQASNIVLFNKSARVIPLHNFEKLKVKLGDWEEEGWEINYKIIEKMVSEDDDLGRSKNFDLDEVGVEKIYSVDYKDTRIPSLKIDLDSIKVHFINAVSYSSEEFDVLHVGSRPNV